MTSKYTVTVTRPILTPQETVEAFYKWYLEFKGHPLLSGAYKKIDYMSSGYKDRLIELIKQKGTDLLSEDPILCSGGAPYEYSVSEYDVSVSDAKATVNADYYGNIVDIELELIKEGRYWVVDSITCPTTSL